MSDVLSELKALMHQRGEHQIAIQQIDAKLTEARKVLGLGPTVQSGPRSLKAPRVYTKDPSRRAGPLTEQSILDALAVREPQTAKMLRDMIGGTTIPAAVSLMAEKGLVYRTVDRLSDADSHHKSYWYARSEEVLKAFVAQQQSDIGGDLEQPEPCAVAAGNTSGMAISPITSPATLEAE